MVHETKNRKFAGSSVSHPCVCVHCRGAGRAEQGKSSGNTGSQRACHARRDSSGKASGIREALESLRRAKAHMEHAAHDFGGHRVEAIEATNQAIKQLELCLKFDKD